MNKLAANYQREQCCFQAMTKFMLQNLEQMDDDGSLPTLLILFHPCCCHLPATIQKLRYQAETCLTCQETNTSPSAGSMSATSQPPENSQYFNPYPRVVQEACTILLKRRNKCSLLMETTQLHQKQRVF